MITNQIQSFQEQELQIRQEISRIVEDSSDLKSIQQAVKKLEDWKQKNNFNPIEDLASNCLDPLLKNFGLKVKTNLDIQKKDDLGFIKIVDFNESEIPNGLLSTGTKQVMLSALPLYLLKPNNTIILYDEPERSLYPNIQKIIVDYYINLTSDSQFFFATHSPIIASCFEPWEIIELKFDEYWNVIQEKYYEGERHIDNYFIDPRYLNYDLILNKVFDMKYTNSDLRTEAITELTMLRNQLDQLKTQNKLKTKKAKDILSRFQDLSKKLLYKVEN